MAKSTALLIQHARKHSDEENACHVAGSLRSQSLEDLRLAERIACALRATGYSVLRDIDVFVNARTVHLVGRVPSYHLKQIAQATALAIPGTHQIHNDVDVIPQGGLQYATTKP
jgi:osmotically-inducible protein OsmY